MQIEDFFYQKDLYLPLGGVERKPEKMSDEDWSVLDRKALGTIRLSLSLLMWRSTSRTKGRLPV